jgi:hypothetical protein
MWRGVQPCGGRQRLRACHPEFREVMESPILSGPLAEKRWRCVVGSQVANRGLPEAQAPADIKARNFSPPFER